MKKKARGEKGDEVPWGCLSKPREKVLRVNGNSRTLKGSDQKKTRKKKKKKTSQVAELKITPGSITG